MPNEPVKITAQELEEIKKLPSCQFMLGGTPQTGFFDKVNEKIYYLDSEGNWMVKRARVKKREPEKPQEEEAPAEENGHTSTYQADYGHVEPSRLPRMPACSGQRSDSYRRRNDQVP